MKLKYTSSGIFITVWLKSTGMPFFYIPGNHDYTNQKCQEVWEDLYGPSYYYFHLQNVLFLCLNTEESDNGGRIERESISSNLII